jgi:Xaa-Pro aminopeptidase
MLGVQSAIKEMARPGVSSGALYEEALRLAIASGWGECFMGTGPERVRFVGHGLGLELDEYPFLAEGQRLVLDEGMVFALEPKLVIPDRGVVGIENTFVVTAGGVEQLTRFPEEICEI